MNVCIIGNGLTSLALAKALVNRDIHVDLICNENTKNYNFYRTLGISKSNIEFFNKDITNIEKILWEINRIKIYTENLSNDEVINFSNSKTQLFSILLNHKLFNKLNLELKKKKFFSYKKNMSYKNIIKKGYKLIINCDFNHEITKKFFSESFKKDYFSSACITVLDHKKLHLNDTAIQIFTNDGPIAFLPISNTKTSVVYSKRNKREQKKIDMRYLIKKYNLKYEINKINEISYFKLKSFNLRKYYVNNILCFGDLLHKLHPLAGQGFNMSIRDIKDLLDLIDKRIYLGLDLDESICIDFQNRSKSKNFIFSEGINLIYEFFNFESKVKSGILSSALKYTAKNKSLNKFFIKLADDGLRI